jgi:SAM-dependent methyltransferase
MLPAGLDRLRALPQDARVLDVGGWAAPVNRADWVIDLMPYATRGALAPGGVGPGPERFDASRWVVRDICGSEPWPFEDDAFDYVVCTFTLEDVRDPLRVCEEMSRVARAGYVEVPSLLDELTWHNPEASGGPWVGHSHHRWLCTSDGATLEFLVKAHSLHSDRRTRVPGRWARQLSMEERVLAVAWAGALRAHERPAIDSYPLDELRAAIDARFAPTPWERLRARVPDTGRFRRAARHS